MLQTHLVMLITVFVAALWKPKCIHAHAVFTRNMLSVCIFPLFWGSVRFSQRLT